MRLPLIRDGIRFECQQSGRCCTSRGSYGYVYLSLPDRRRLAQFLGMRTSSFTRRYCDKSGDYYHLKSPEDDCGFLEGKRCGVYNARPTQCRTWPFWPENLNPRVWREEVASFCPGIGKGRLYTADEIKQIIKDGHAESLGSNTMERSCS